MLKTNKYEKKSLVRLIFLIFLLHFRYIMISFGATRDPHPLFEYLGISVIKEVSWVNLITIIYLTGGYVQLQLCVYGLLGHQLSPGNGCLLESFPVLTPRVVGTCGQDNPSRFLNKCCLPPYEFLIHRNVSYRRKFILKSGVLSYVVRHKKTGKRAHTIIPAIICFYN